MESLSGAVAESCHQHDGVRREMNEMVGVLANRLERVSTAASDSSAAVNERVELLEQEFGNFEMRHRADAQSVGSRIENFQDNVQAALPLSAAMRSPICTLSPGLRPGDERLETRRVSV